MTHFTLKQINDMQANGEISMTEAIQLRIETRRAIEAGKADEQPKQQKRKQPKHAEPEEEEEEDTDTIAPPPKQPKRKQPKQTEKQAKQTEKPKVEKFDIPGATEIEYCPTAVIFLGEGRYPGTYAFKIGKEVSVRSADVWSLLSYELYSEPVGQFIRDQIGL